MLGKCPKNSTKRNLVMVLLDGLYWYFNGNHWSFSEGFFSRVIIFRRTRCPHYCLLVMQSPIHFREPVLSGQFGSLNRFFPDSTVLSGQFGSLNRFFPDSSVLSGQFGSLNRFFPDSSAH